jgi:hypothetical protein
MEKLNLVTNNKGEDFQTALQEALSVKKQTENEFIEALRIQASKMKEDSDSLYKVANLIALLGVDQQTQVKLNGKGHTILIDGPEKFINILKSHKLI